MLLDQNRYRLRAGDRVPIAASEETLTFMRAAKSRSALASGVSSRSFPVAPNVAADQVLLGVPLTTAPGNYSVAVSFFSEAGDERIATIQVTVEPFAAPVASSTPPVVLLDGFQADGCPMSSDSSGTFDHLQTYLEGPPNNISSIYFFENCTECPNCTIEQLGADLATFLSLLAAPQVDVVAHSMGGLIVRSYLSGKQAASGAFSPPAVQKIRKAIFVATPHFGSFQADSSLADILFAAGNQDKEMKRGSQFLWDLATWNQFREDLRGVDALAVIANGGSYNSLTQASDGVVALSSGSLDFVSPGRTRVIPNYCHIPLTAGIEAGYLECVGPGIAYVDSTSHPTYQIVSSFLMSRTAWESVGSAPGQDQYLSKYGGLVVADVNASDQFVGGLSEVSWGAVNPVNLSDGAASGELFYNDFLEGTGTFAFGATTCGPYTVTAGVYSTVRCKFGPSVFSVGPLLPGPGKVVQAGTTITIGGAGFGTQCAACQVTASNPESTTLQVLSWSNSEITAFLPASFGVGIATIGVTTTGGSDAINIMAGTVVVPPAISLSRSSLSFAFTVGGTTPAAQSVSVANTGGGTLTYSVASNAAWLIASASGSTITVSINPAGLTANTYQGIVTVASSAASNSPQTISVVLTVSAVPVSPVAVSAVVNAASWAGGPIAPGELVVIWGLMLGPSTGVAGTVDPSTGKMVSQLAGTTVLFNGIAAPLLYSSATQVNAIVPYEVTGCTQTMLQVEYQAALSTGTALPCASAAPGIFTFNSSGTGPAAAANQDGTLNGPSSPAAKGSYVMLYFTGGGETSPAGVTGSITGTSVLKSLTQPVSVTVGGVGATVAFDGAAPTFVDGLLQLNIQLSDSTPSGTALPVVITVGSTSGPATATLAAQ